MMLMVLIAPISRSEDRLEHSDDCFGGCLYLVLYNRTYAKFEELLTLAAKNYISHSSSVVERCNTWVRNGSNKKGEELLH